MLDVRAVCAYSTRMNNEPVALIINGTSVGTYRSAFEAMKAANWTFGMAQARRSGLIVSMVSDKCAARVIYTTRPDVD